MCVIPFISWQRFYLSFISNPSFPSPPLATQSSPIQDQLFLNGHWPPSSTSSVLQIIFSSPDENTSCTCSQRKGNAPSTQFTLTVLSGVIQRFELERISEIVLKAPVGSAESVFIISNTDAVPDPPKPVPTNKCIWSKTSPIVGWLPSPMLRGRASHSDSRGFKQPASDLRDISS